MVDVALKLPRGPELRKVAAHPGAVQRKKVLRMNGSLRNAAASSSVAQAPATSLLRSARP